MLRPTLSRKEKKENVFMTLGRLRVAIHQINVENGEERAIELLNKLGDDVSRMDIKLLPKDRATF